MSSVSQAETKPSNSLSLEGDDSSSVSTPLSPPSPPHWVRPTPDPLDRPTFLKMWNNELTPEKLSCRTAFDVWMYCWTPANQLRTLYRTGGPTMCSKQYDNFRLCMRVKTKYFSGGADPRKVNTGRELLARSRDGEQGEVDKLMESIWEKRAEPLEQFREAERIMKEKEEKKSEEGV